MSYRLSSSDAMPARAACPPESAVIGRVQVDRQTQFGGDLLGPFGQVRAAEGEPAFQRGAVRVIGARRARR